MKQVYDYLVIGAGSGGIASSRRAAQYGAKTGIIEYSRLGGNLDFIVLFTYVQFLTWCIIGTCVNVGCVPKKVMWNAVSISEALNHSKDYGFNVDLNGFDWKTVKEKRDAYITRLNVIIFSLFLF